MAFVFPISTIAGSNLALLKSHSHRAYHEVENGLLFSEKNIFSEETTILSRVIRRRSVNATLNQKLREIPLTDLV